VDDYFAMWWYRWCGNLGLCVSVRYVDFCLSPIMRDADQALRCYKDQSADPRHLEITSWCIVRRTVWIASVSRLRAVEYNTDCKTSISRGRTIRLLSRIGCLQFASLLCQRSTMGRV
jgi:hypothetical protein